MNHSALLAAVIVSVAPATYESIKDSKDHKEFRIKKNESSCFLKGSKYKTKYFKQGGS